MFHLTLGQLLLENDSKFLEPFTSLFDVVDGDGDVTETSPRFSVTAGVTLEVGVRFGSVVPGQFQDTFRYAALTIICAVEALSSPSRVKR